MERSQFYSPQAGRHIEAPRHSSARFGIGDVVRHKLFDFRGVVFDVDPVFANSEEWYEAIPLEMRPRRPSKVPAPAIPSLHASQRFGGLGKPERFG